MQLNKKLMNKLMLSIITITQQRKKVEAIGRINNAKQEALDNINSATMNQAVTSAKNEGINNINLIQSSTSTKTNAKSDIDRKLSEQIENINQHQTATTEEKDTAVQLANQKLMKQKIIFKLQRITKALLRLRQMA